LAGVLALSVSIAARADDATAEREAQARFEEGIARVKAGNLEGARMSFTQAYAIVHKPTILWNLALAEEKTKHVLDALGHFKELARGPQPAEDRASADKHIADLMAQTGHIEVAAPAGAQVLVDGAPVATAPLSEALDVLPGRHHVETHTGQGAKEADVDVAAGQVLHLNLLPPSDATRATGTAPAPRDANTRPPVTTEPAASGGTAAEHAGGNGPSAPQIIAVAVIGTAAVVSVSLGAFFALQSQSDQSTAQGFRRNNPSSSYCYPPPVADRSAACAAWNNAVQTQSNDFTLSSVFYAAGGVLAAGALATWFLWPKASSTADGASVGLIPAAGPAGPGLSAVGRF
jgi:hypothetical protein